LSCSCTLPPPLTFLPPTYKLHFPALLHSRGNRATERWKKSNSYPSLGIWSPPGKRREEEGQAWLGLRSLLPCCLQSLHPSLSSCPFPQAQAEILPSDPEIAPLLQAHSAQPRCTMSLGTSPALLLPTANLPAPSPVPTHDFLLAYSPPSIY
jgi:hypothetical protein